ncbi:MAG: hypothetical protein OXF44_07215 [Anaerolineaceae bacterium]|nr:hypothetical protein [Anaerolineaceae bacterium]
MERVGDMTREELRQLVGEVVEERLERALRENGITGPSPDRERNAGSRKEILEEIRRRSRKLGRASESWSNPVVEEREAIRKRNWAEVSEEIDRIGWTPPADAATPQQMLREDRDR